MIVTPSIIRAELLALFRELDEKVLVENFDQYKTDLVVEHNADDRNCVDVMSQRANTACSAMGMVR